MYQGFPLQKGMNDFVTEPQPKKYLHFWSAFQSLALQCVVTKIPTLTHNKHKCSPRTNRHSELLCQQADSQQPGLSRKILSSAVIADTCLVTGINGQQSTAKAVWLENTTPCVCREILAWGKVPDNGWSAQTSTVFQDEKCLFKTLKSRETAKRLQCWEKSLLIKPLFRSLFIDYLLSLLSSSRFPHLNSQRW